MENELENVPPSLASQRLAHPYRVTNLPVQYLAFDVYEYEGIININQS